jgi:hypothetical protein
MLNIFRPLVVGPLLVLAVSLPVHAQEYFVVASRPSARPAEPLDLFHFDPSAITVVAPPKPSAPQEVMVVSQARPVGRAPAVRLSALYEFYPALADGKCVTVDADLLGGPVRVAEGTPSERTEKTVTLRVSWRVPYAAGVEVDARAGLGARTETEPMHEAVWTAGVDVKF